MTSPVSPLLDTALALSPNASGPESQLGSRVANNGDAGDVTGLALAVCQTCKAKKYLARWAPGKNAKHLGKLERIRTAAELAPGVEAGGVVVDRYLNVVV